MGQCITCGKKGILLRTDQNGVCKECQESVYPALQEQLGLVQEAEQAFGQSQGWKEELQACDQAVKALEELGKWEGKGLRTGLPQPAEQMKQQVQAMRDQFVEKAVASAYAQANQNIQSTKNPEDRIKAAKFGLDEISSIQFLGGHVSSMDQFRKKLHEVYDKLQYKIYAVKAKTAEEMSEYQDALEAYRQSILYLRECMHLDEKYKQVAKKLEMKVKIMEEKVAEKKVRAREKKRNK